jgi:hypothetical protein
MYRNSAFIKPAVVRFAALFAFLAFVGTCFAGDDLASFIDAYEKALTARTSVTARISCKFFDGAGKPMAKELDGVVTFGGYQDSFSVMTLRREEELVQGKSVNTILLSSRDGAIRMVDVREGAYYEENAAKMGAGLVARDLDDVFLVVMYPALLDRMRSSKGVVRKDGIGPRHFLRARMDGGRDILELVVDAETYLPVSIRRMGPDAYGRTVQTELMFAEAHTTGRQPPDALFDVNLVFGFPKKRFDPEGLFALGVAPNFEANTLDGRDFSLAAQKGHVVFLCFRGGDETDMIRDLYFDRTGDAVRARGGMFIDILPPVSGNSTAVTRVNSPANTCRSDVAANLYHVSGLRMPCLVMVTPEGRLGDAFVGYIPGVTERAMDAFIDSWLPTEKSGAGSK